MKIAIGTSWFCDPLIFRMLDSIPKHWDVKLVDGRYTGLRAKENLSPKKMRMDISKNYSNVQYRSFTGKEDQKRSQYLDMSKGYDYLIVIDSDEYILKLDESAFVESLSKQKTGFHLVKFMRNNQETQYGRIFTDPFSWRYKTHKYITNGVEIRPVSLTDSLIDGILLCHDDSSRPEELKQKIQKYQDKLWSSETSSLHAKSKRYS